MIFYASMCSLIIIQKLVFFIKKYAIGKNRGKKVRKVIEMNQ